MICILNNIVIFSDFSENDIISEILKELSNHNER